MSLAGLPVVNVEDATLALVNEKPMYGIPTGAEQLTTVITPANGFSINTAPNTITYNVQPPKGMAIGRVMLQRWQVQSTITGTQGTGPLLQPGTGFGPRQWPISSCINNVQMTINTGSINLQYDVLPMLFRCRAFWDCDEIELTTFPNALDQFQRYGDWAVYGSARNPLNFYGEWSFGRVHSRGGFPGFSVVSNGSGGGTLTSVVTLNVWEPLILSPWLQKGQVADFVGLNQATLTINISDTSYQRLWSMDTTSSGASAFASCTTIFTAVPTVTVLQKTPSVLNTIPDRALYAYDRVYRFTTAMSNMAPNATQQVTTSQPISLSFIPPIILIGARRAQATWNISTSDVFLAMQSLNIIWNGNAGPLSTFDQAQLYKIAKKNSSNLSYDQFAFYCGSVIALVPGIDFQIGAGEACNLGGSTWTIAVQATFQNTNQVDTITPELVVVALTNGVAELIEGGGFNSLDAPVTQQDILEARQTQSKPLMEDDVASMVGGSIFSDIGSFIKKAASSAYNYLAPRVAPHAQRFVEGAVEKYAPRAVQAGERFLEKAFTGRGLTRRGGKKRAGALMRGSGLPLMAEKHQMDVKDDEEDDVKERSTRRMRGAGFIDDEGSKHPEQHKYEEQFAAASAVPLPSASTRRLSLAERF